MGRRSEQPRRRAFRPTGDEVFVSDTIPLALPDLLPDGSGRTWALVSTTLIQGAKDAVLVDPPLTTGQATRVGDWVQATGKRLTHILATHAHGDYWFTAAMLQGRFPEAQVVATAGTIPESPVTAVPAEHLGNRVPLEGHELIVIDVGPSDTEDTSVLHVPELELAVTGDVIYNGVHQFLVESGHGGRDAWRTAIDTLVATDARWIVAGHKNRGRDDDAARVIAETRRYLDDADELLEAEPTPTGFFAAMLRRHSGHLNASSLWGSSQALHAGRLRPDAASSKEGVSDSWAWFTSGGNGASS